MGLRASGRGNILPFTKLLVPSFLSIYWINSWVENNYHKDMSSVELRSLIKIGIEFMTLDPGPEYLSSCIHSHA